MRQNFKWKLSKGNEKVESFLDPQEGTDAQRSAGQALNGRDRSQVELKPQIDRNHLTQRSILNQTQRPGSGCGVRDAKLLQRLVTLVTPPASFKSSGFKSSWRRLWRSVWRGSVSSKNSHRCKLQLWPLFRQHEQIHSLRALNESKWSISSWKSRQNDLVFQSRPILFFSICFFTLKKKKSQHHQLCVILPFSSRKVTTDCGNFLSAISPSVITAVALWPDLCSSSSPFLLLLRLLLLSPLLPPPSLEKKQKLKVVMMSHVLVAVTDRQPDKDAFESRL